MGLFSFVGKALKGVAKLAGKVVGGVANQVTGGLAGKAYKVAKFLVSKPSVASMAKLAKNQAGATLADAAISWGGGMPVLKGRAGVSTGVIQSMSPVLPGGSIITERGIVDAGTRYHPATGHAIRTAGNPGRGGSTRRRRVGRSMSRRRATHRRGSRTTHSRKLKFGSPAWQRKYNPRARGKRRSKRAA